MKKNYLFWVALVVTTISFGQSIFINEIHYDNTGGDVDEGVEIVGPAGTDLAGYKVYLYNGNGSKIYGNISFSGIIPNQQNNRGTLWFPQPSIQNDREGLALVNTADEVIQFLSYEGVIVAIDGPAIGLTSVDIGISEPGAIGESLQLIGTGNVYSDFTWFGPTTATSGALNSNQTLSVEKNQIKGFSMYPNPVIEGKFVIASNSRENKTVEIYSMVGQQVFSKSVQANEIVDVANLTTGFYFLKVEEEGKIATRKLIIK